MVELADAQDLGSCEEIRVGSPPATRTNVNRRVAGNGGSSFIQLIIKFGGVKMLDMIGSFGSGIGTNLLSDSLSKKLEAFKDKKAIASFI